MRFVLREDGTFEVNFNSDSEEGLAWHIVVTLRHQKVEQQRSPVPWWGSSRRNKLVVGCESQKDVPSTVEWMKKTYPLPCHYRVEVLKSALQKAIRFRMSNSAARIAWQLIRQDPDAFLRRWPVIVAEDAIPCVPMLRCLWLMITHSRKTEGNHRPLTKDDVHHLLYTVFRVAESRRYDVIPLSPQYQAYSIPDSAETPKDLTGCEIEFVNENLFAMLLRTPYGGMDGDVLFQRAFVGLWKDRFRQHKDEWSQFLQSTLRREDDYFHALDYEDMALSLGDNNMQEEDKFLEAVDFHCDRKHFIERLHDALPHDLQVKLTVEDLQQMIWHCRSAVYERILVSTASDATRVWEEATFEHSRVRDPASFEKYREDMERIRPIVDKISYGYWRSVLPSRKRRAPSSSRATPSSRKRRVIVAVNSGNSN